MWLYVPLPALLWRGQSLAMMPSVEADNFKPPEQTLPEHYDLRWCVTQCIVCSG